MARHRNNVHLPTIPEVPWSLGIAIAGLVYVALRLVLFGFSGGEPFLPMLKSLLRANSGLVLLVVGTGAFSEVLRIAWRSEHTRGVDLARVRALPWQEFKTVCADALQLLGYRRDLGDVRSAPNNADLILHLGDAPVLVHCSRWRSLHVGIREVREFYDDVLAYGALRGVFVTSGTFTGAATLFSQGKPLDLIDGDRLGALLWDARCDLRPHQRGVVPGLGARLTSAALAPQTEPQRLEECSGGAARAKTAEGSLSKPLDPET
ncbi:restriction endonuclease [Methylotetracoccus oryzae]|uniref:restriction endonuclease n=1 Tax=Methylotetracoccus oryzae TaxID=1919059 RepID=UPI001117E861|nr:restriction endonuclease [Methylotetracoccus oryzae]